MIVIRTYEIKLKPNKSQKKQLNQYFYEAKLLYNYFLSCSNVFAIQSWRVKHAWKYDKDGDRIKVEINTLPVLLRQGIQKQITDAIVALTALKKKGHKVGKLKFKSVRTTLELDNQCYAIKNSNHIRLAGFGRKYIKCYGLHQLEDAIKLRNAKLMKRGNEYFLKICVSKEVDIHQSTSNVIGIDFGIKDNFTLSDGRKLNFCIEETVRLKKLQRRFARSKRINGKKSRTNNQQKLLTKIHKEYQKMSNQRTEFVNQFLHQLDVNYDIIAFQDEQIKGWINLKGNRRTIQHSCLGTMKRRLIEKSHEQPQRYLMHSKWQPTTQSCPRCHKKNKHNLDKRIYHCSCGYSFDRDVHAARNMLIFAGVSVDF